MIVPEADVTAAVSVIVLPVVMFAALPEAAVTVKAVVVVNENFKLSEAELVEHCRGRLAAYKVPASVAFVGALPKGPTGKILKRELREREALSR